VCRTLCHESLGHDPRFATAVLREENSAALVAILDEIFRQRTRDEWGRRFDEADLIWAPVLLPQEIIDSEQAKEAEVFFDATHPAVGSFRLLRSPINFSRTPARFRRRAPFLGEHTSEVLKEAGFTDEQIGDMKSSGAVGPA
jgi:crotonobetainyl-CoA:carnitine CoA-transferase CaiB-like acyl-CoA transferase